MAIRNVVLAGASSGNLGPKILNAVLSSEKFNVTVFTRQGSSSTSPPAGVQTIAVDYNSVEDLTFKLQGQDAVVSTLASTATGDPQANLLQAALAAGVPRFIPSEFGSDLDNPVNRALPVYGHKVAVQEKLKALAQEGKISYTFIYNGAFFDWGLQLGFVLDPRKKKAVLHDGGERQFTTTTLAAIGKAVVGVLSHPEETENRSVRVGEVGISLKELLGLAQEVVGSDGWTVTESDTEKKAEEALAKIKQGILTPESLVPLLHKAIWGKGTGGFFEKTDNELLGVQQLDSAGIKKVIQDVVEGKN